MSVEELTKKEQIINFAQNDPFLKISDIAEYVQTTPRYVRTILSEANISLMKLREKYARSMEKRLQTHDEPEPDTGLRLKPTKGDMEIGDLGVDLLLDEEFEGLQKMGKEEKLWRVHQVFFSNNNPYCVKELIAFFADDLHTERINSLEAVYEMFGKKGINHLHFMDSIVRIDHVDEHVRKLLGLKKTEMAMVVSRYILMNKIPVGVEHYYLRPDKVEMRFSGQLVMQELRAISLK